MFKTKNVIFEKIKIKLCCYLIGNEWNFLQRLALQPTHSCLRTHAHARKCTRINTASQLPGALRRLAAEGSTMTPPTLKHASEQQAHEHPQQSHTHT